jgi:putative endonuclease
MPALSNFRKKQAMAKPKAPPAPARVAAFQSGIDAEARAAEYLTARGFEILAQRFKSPYGEVDLIARSGNLIIFVEVKARGTLDDAAYAVTVRQKKRIIDTSQFWLAANPDYANFDLRFDAMLIAPKRLPRHLIAAFDASDLAQPY